MAALPWCLNQRLGWLLGQLLRRKRSMQRVTQRNVSLCLPELPQAELVAASCEGLGMNLMEIGAVWCWSGPRLQALVRMVEGQECLDQALAEGKGVILASPHVGNWELTYLVVSLRHPLTALYRPLRQPALERLVLQARKRFAANVLPANARGVRQAHRCLQQGGMLALLPDQEPQAGHGVFAPFFGQQAYTMTLLPRLVARHDCPVVFAWTERCVDGTGFSLHFSDSTGLGVPGQVNTPARMNRCLEQLIRRAPGQYQWGYPRFRQRPEGCSPFYS